MRQHDPTHYIAYTDIFNGTHKYVHALEVSMAKNQQVEVVQNGRPQNTGDRSQYMLDATQIAQIYSKQI